MPIFEYQCLQCGTRIEVILRGDDKAPAKCEECGGELKKLVSAPAFQFKGSGWYVTDYAGKKGGADGQDGKKEKGASAAEGSGSGEGSSKESSSGSGSSDGDKSSAKSSDKGSDKSGEKRTEKSTDRSTDKSKSATTASPAPKSESSA